MRYLILGGDGMLGHQLLKSLRGRHEVLVTLRSSRGTHAPNLFTPDNSVAGVDARDYDGLKGLLARWKPEVVVNAIGIVKQRHEAKDPLASLEVNALLPHKLQALCLAAGMRLIHFSTDCVFTGRHGNYSEADCSDAQDLYGRTKHLGEVAVPPAITLRSSIIGCELKERLGLVEWFLQQQGTIKGFTRARFSGLTTMEMARVVELVAGRADLNGVYQVSAAPITKHDLLAMLSDRLGRRDVAIVPDDSLVCDRTLNGSAFARATGYRAPTWETMLTELAEQILEERGLHAKSTGRKDHPDHWGHRLAR